MFCIFHISSAFADLSNGDIVRHIPPHSCSFRLSGTPTVLPCPLWFRWMLCLCVMASCFPVLILLGRVTQGYAMWRFMGQSKLQWQALAEHLLGHSSCNDTNAAQCSQDPFFSHYMEHFIRVLLVACYGRKALEFQRCNVQTSLTVQFKIIGSLLKGCQKAILFS